MTQPRILFFDIESAGVTALKSDLGFVIVFGYKWAGDKEASALSLTQRALKEFDDRELLIKASKLFEEADLLVGHFACVAPSTRILTADFRYKAAGDLEEGEELLALEENVPGMGLRRRFSSSIVTHAKIRNAPKLRLELSDGTTLDVTKNHPFLVPIGVANGSNWQWKEAQGLKVGDVLTRVVPVWETNYGYEAGYLAAAADGEGHVCISPDIQLGFSQKPNAMLERFKEYSYRHNYRFVEHCPDTLVKHLDLEGGIFPVFKFLGEVRPPRLLAKALEHIPELCLNVPKENRTTIVNIHYIGVSSVVNLTTSSATYITEGFASHNSVFDRRFIQGRLLIHGLPPIPPVKLRDTCMIARSVANYSSNRLKYLAKILNLKHQKLDNGWPDAWFQVMRGNMQALKGLADYCKGDVLALEDLYNRLQPFDQAFPRLIPDRSVCGGCGGAVEYRGYSYARGRKYRRFKCKKCSKWGQDARAVKEQA